MKTRKEFIGFGTVVVALCIWELVARSMHSVYVPPVTTIAKTFVHEWFSPIFRQEAIPSLWRMIVGYLCAAVLGSALGVSIGASRPLYRMLDPVLQFFRAIPPTAIIPVGILLIGIGDSMKIVVITFGAFWPILVNSADGARNVIGERLDSARIYGFKPMEILISVIVPSAAPSIFAGLRTGLSIAFIMIVVSEMIGSTNGLGYYILQAQRTFAIPEMYGGIVLLAFLGYLLNVGFLFFERRVLAWHYGQSARAA